jgi:hypothetical protein
MRRLSGLFVLVVAIAACSKPAAMFSTEKLKPSGYNVYKTYAFVPTKDTQYARIINRQVLVPLLIEEVTRQLNAKGLTLDTVHPDCLFTYNLVVKREMDASRDQKVDYKPQYYNAGEIPNVNSYGVGITGASAVRAGTDPGSGYYYYSSDNRPYSYAGKTIIDTMREGSMVIDMIDAKTREVIWRSKAESKRPESMVLTAKEAQQYYIPKMLKDLPRK